MKPLPDHLPERGRRWAGIDRRTALALYLAMATGSFAFADTPKPEAFQHDAQFLSGKVAQYRYRLKSSDRGRQRLAEMEAALARLQSLAQALSDDASTLAEEDSHLHYLTDMELGPKERAVDQAQRNANDQLGKLVQREENLAAMIERHNAQPHEFTEEQQAAAAAYQREADDLNARQSALAEEDKELRAQCQGLVEAAIQAYAKAQKDFGETAAKRERTAAHFQSGSDQYAAARAPIVDGLVALDNEPPSPAQVPLTPFSGTVAPGDAGLVPVSPPPVGPGNNRHAIDQLRVVTASSRQAAGLDDHGAPTTTPADPVSKVDSGYQFDTGGGLGVAEMPAVEAPEGVAVVPLVVPPEAPAAGQSALLRKFEREQDEGLTRLKQLYEERNKLLQPGAPPADPQVLTKLIDDISATQGAVNLAAVAKQLANGSKPIDLTIQLKPTRRKTDLDLPAPPVPQPAKP